MQKSARISHVGRHARSRRATCLAITLAAGLAALAGAEESCYEAKVAVTGAPASSVSPRIFGSNIMWREYEVSADYQRAHLQRWRPHVWEHLQRGWHPWQVFREVGITLLRFPGGAEAHRYRWDSLDATRRVFRESKNRAGKSLYTNWMARTESYQWTLDMFLDHCRKFGIEPLLQAPTIVAWPADTNRWRYVWKPGVTPKRLDDRLVDAAARYAASMVRRTVHLGADVRLWEIGNEDYFYFSARQYSSILRRFSAAMRREKRNIRIIATGHDRAWNEVILKEASDAFELLALHLYPKPLGVDFPSQEAACDTQTLYWAYLASVARCARSFRYVRGFGKAAAVTEWNLPYRSRLMYAPAGALVLARLLCLFAEADVDVANYWCVTGWNFEMLKLPDVEYPTAKVLRLLSRNLRGALLTCSVSAPTKAVAGTPVSYLTAHVTRQGEEVHVVMLNLHPAYCARVTVKLPGMALPRGLPPARGWRAKTLIPDRPRMHPCAGWQQVRTTVSRVSEHEMELTLPPATCLAWKATLTDSQGQETKR